MKAFIIGGEPVTGNRLGDSTTNLLMHLVIVSLAISEWGFITGILCGVIPHIIGTCLNYWAKKKVLDFHSKTKIDSAQ